MVYTYSPSFYYYSSFHETLASLCKSLLLPFSSSSRKSRQLPSDDQINNNKFAKRQTDNLKWQQDSFHRILNLIGLHKEGLVPEADVSAFRSHLLDTLLASPTDQPEPPPLTRDRLLFLQELLYADCISADLYRSSETPLLHRLALQVEEEEEDWSVIELGDQRELPPPVPKSTKQQTPPKSLFKWKGKAKKKKKKKKKEKDPSATTDAGNGGGGSVLMPESSPGVNKSEKSSAQKPTKKKHWGLDGLKKWRRGDDAKKEDESTAPNYLLAGDRPEDASTVVVPCDGLAEGEKIKEEEEEEELNEPLVVDAAREEIKDDHSNAYNGDPGGWVAFEEDEENRHPNLFFPDQSVSKYRGMDEANCKALQSKEDARDCFRNNPFVDDRNPFWATKIS